MDIVAQLLVLLHLIGFATLFGGIVVQLRLLDPEVNAAMLLGAWGELLTGLALVALPLLNVLGVYPAGPAEQWMRTVRPDGVLDFSQLGVKLAITAFVVLLVSVNRKFASIPRGLLALMGLLTLSSAAVAVLWP